MFPVAKGASIRPDEPQVSRRLGCWRLLRVEAVGGHGAMRFGARAGLPGARAAQPDAAARVLADMRTSIGADALMMLQGFSISGTERTLSRGSLRKHVAPAWVCSLPDRCIEVRSYVSFLASSTHTVGFNGDHLVWFPGSRPPRTPAALPPRVNARVALRELGRQFSRLAVLLLGDAPFYPYEATWVGVGPTDGRSVDVLELKARDGYELRLHVDRAAHLPVMLAWSERDTGEHQLYVSDFRNAAGVLWPHRLTEYAGGQVVRELQVRKYRVNPKIDPNRFDPVR
jgi:hypothetical protein